MQPPRTSLPVGFANPENPNSEHPIDDISVNNLLIGQIDTNEASRKNVNQTLNHVDRVLEHTDHSLQTYLLELTINMNENRTLLNTNQFETENFGTFNENQRSNQTPNLMQELLSNYGISVDTIGLEAALKLLPQTFSGANNEDLELFFEQCEFAILCANEKAKQRLL